MDWECAGLWPTHLFEKKKKRGDSHQFTLDALFDTLLYFLNFTFMEVLAVMFISGQLIKS